MDRQTRPIVIGITGIAGSGKDTAANLLVANHGFTRIALADPIKDLLDRLSGPTRQLHKELEAAGRSQRWAWQVIGTECRESIGSAAHWIDHALIGMDYLRSVHPAARQRFVIPDASYEHETIGLSQWARSYGGTYQTWRIDNPRVQPIAESAHSSEEGRRSIVADITVVNDGTIDQLRQRLESALRWAEAEDGDRYDAVVAS